MVSLQNDECRVLAEYIQSICGVQLDESKQYLIESRLAGLLEQTGSPSYGSLYQRARMDASGHIERSIINAITTGETSFFRDQSPFELLRQKILPDLIDRRSRSDAARIPIRIWSAACSTGQELYSIAMVLRDVLAGTQSYEVRLVGTDISPEAVARASAGVYNATEAARGMNPALLARFFLRKGEDWRVRDDIRGMVSFRPLNLLRDFSTLGQFDVIFCRNVAIYFSERDKAALFGRLGNALAGGGYLVIGATESLTGVCPEFEMKRHGGGTYYQLRTR